MQAQSREGATAGLNGMLQACSAMAALWIVQPALGSPALASVSKSAVRTQGLMARTRHELGWCGKGCGDPPRTKGGMKSQRPERGWFLPGGASSCPRGPEGQLPTSMLSAGGISGWNRCMLVGRLRMGAVTAPDRPAAAQPAPPSRWRSVRPARGH